MPIHDWSRAEAGVFHDFRHSWIAEIARGLNSGTLPDDHYALVERHAARFGPDILALQSARDDGGDDIGPPDAPTDEGRGLLLAPPKARHMAEAEADFYRRKQSAVAIRHVTGDRVVAIVEVVSPGNKNSQNALRKFVEKVAELLERGIHLLVLDLLPPGPRDPGGIHGAIWDEIDGRPYDPPADKPLTLAAYESDLAFRAYVEPVAVGDVLPDMPLFLRPGGQVPLPLEATYRSAWEVVPRRWRSVIQAP